MRQQQKALLQEWPEKALGEVGTGSGNPWFESSIASKFYEQGNWYKKDDDIDGSAAELLAELRARR